MDYFQAAVLAAVEGLTEFLPISSTGHLVLATKLLDIKQTEFVKSFEIIIQLGAIFAILFLYRKTLLTSKKVWTAVITAFLPTAILGFTLYRVIKDIFLGNTIITLTALFVGGIILIAYELIHKEKESHADTIDKITLRQAFFIGLFQSISMIPGVSRSGATIIGGLFLGLKRKTAVEFSFLLAVPTMFGATGLDLVKSNFSFSSSEYTILAIGFIGSFFVAILAVKLFLRFVQNHTLIPFGIYRIILSVLFFLMIQ